MQIVTEEILARLKSFAEDGTLRQGEWNGHADGAEMACMMSALVAGAKSGSDCVAAGWPEWLVNLNVRLFYDAPDIETATQFSFDLARACMAERNYDKARDIFLISRLDTGEHSALKTLRSLEGDFSQQIEAVERAASLLRRRVGGEDVAEEMNAAADAAYAAADAAYAAYARHDLIEAIKAA